MMAHINYRCQSRNTGCVARLAYELGWPEAERARRSLREATASINDRCLHERERVWE